VADFDETPMSVDKVVRVGDVVLVDDGDPEAPLFEPYMDLYGYTTLVGADVVSESGVPLGRVRDFVMSDGAGEAGRARGQGRGIPRRIHTLILDALGLDFVPDILVSTYALDVDEVLSVGPQRLLVFEGAEERLEQLTIGPLLRLNLAEPPWAEAVALARGGGGGRRSAYYNERGVRFVDPNRVMYGEEAVEEEEEVEFQGQPWSRRAQAEIEGQARAQKVPRGRRPRPEDAARPFLGDVRSPAASAAAPPPELAGAQVADRYGEWEGAAELVRGDMPLAPRTPEEMRGKWVTFDDWIELAGAPDAEEVGMTRGGGARQQPLRQPRTRYPPNTPPPLGRTLNEQ